MAVDHQVVDHVFLFHFSILYNILFNFHRSVAIYYAKFIYSGVDAKSGGKLYFIRQSNSIILRIKRYF